MQYVISFVISLSALVAFLFATSDVKAVSQNVMISQVQLAGFGSGAASQEFVLLYNTSSTDVEVTNWCLSYTSSSGATSSSLICIRPNDTSIKLWLKAYSSAMFVSPDYKNMIGGMPGDGTFTYRSGIASTGGRIRLVDAIGNEIDRVAWGNMVGEAAAVEPPAGKVLQRVGGGTLQDTDDSSVDFSVGVPWLRPSGIYETVIDVCPNINGFQVSLPSGYMFNDQGGCVEIPPIDACLNIAEFQSSVPQGYLLDDFGNCQPDRCMNIYGLQISVPDGYDENGDGSCSERDLCGNLDGMQHEVPVNYIRDSTGMCKINIVPLVISEVLPNPRGVDTGSEFIELYNPSDKVVRLDMYMLSIGTSAQKYYNFPPSDEYTIKPGEYKIIKDTDLGFTLTNTSGRVVLQSLDGTVYSDSGVYTSAADDMAWTLIDDTWLFSDSPTPGSVNVLPMVDEPTFNVATQTLAAVCPAGKYRNALTNRCRTIESDASVLAVCDSDQYRNPETGRCKKIASSSTVTPCKDGQYRSEETNRCRAVSSANATLAPCKEGQERNPDTNRCRNAATTSVPAAAYAVEPVKDGIKAFVGWWAIGGIGLLALGYAGWEWRRELKSIVLRIISIRSIK